MTFAAEGIIANRQILVSKRFVLIENKRNGSQNRQATE
jgi:hypothetical protein